MIYDKMLCDLWYDAMWFMIRWHMFIIDDIRWCLWLLFDDIWRCFYGYLMLYEDVYDCIHDDVWWSYN
jgi:hypothetical protein